MSIGLYDVVNNKFYANAGTGSFVAGASVGVNNNERLIPTTSMASEILSIETVTGTDVD